ncbi:hypothetical protein EZS27_000869 [termite gut metagenome]|uniref:Uncharacterized protein n=1 Tax=termite gut metagenome TaxID=433724 RepID=A0A5J4T0D0_9ZZZZ
MVQTLKDNLIIRKIKKTPVVYWNKDVKLPELVGIVKHQDRTITLCN